MIPLNPAERIKILEGVVRFLRRAYLKRTEFGEGSVTTEKLANAAVTSIKIANDAVTTPKIADFAITPIKIETGAVVTEKIAAKAVTGAKMSMTYKHSDSLATNFSTTTAEAFVDTGIELSFTTTDAGTVWLVGKGTVNHSVAGARLIVRIVDQAGTEVARGHTICAVANAWTTAPAIQTLHYTLAANTTYTFKLQLYSYDAGTSGLIRTSTAYTGIIAHIFGAL